jgi:hypothetical protein
MMSVRFMGLSQVLACLGVSQRDSEKRDRKSGH